MNSPLRRSARSGSQRGGALLILTLILVLGTTWAIVSALNGARNDAAAKQISNAALLRQAKSALLGYIAIKAGSSANPGVLPCPEIANPTPATEGTTAPSCTLPAIGRLPWRTLGIDKLADAAGEPLWYVLSPGFNGSGASFKINSNTAAQLTLDGVANAAVALIIAPGNPLNSLNLPALSGCTLRSQQRNRTFPLDYRDYLECDNATSPADNSFSSTGTTGYFNDQVMALTHADVFNIVEAAVAKRIQTDIVPSLIGVYNSANWNATPTTPLFPFAAPFSNPDTSSYTGAIGTYQGLLPLSYSTQADTVTDCVVSASDPRCNPSLVAWRHDGTLSYAAPLPIQNNARWSVYSTYPTMSVPAFNPYIYLTEVDNSEQTRATLAKLNCSASTSTQISCAITYGRSCDGCSAFYTVRPQVRLTVRAFNVAKAFKMFDTSQLLLPERNYFKSRATATSYGASPLGHLRSDGNADITTEWLLPSAYCNTSLCATATIRIPIAFITDHAILSSIDATTGWFLSNDWHKLTYYAVSSGNAPGGNGTCVAGGSPACLTLNSPAGTASPNAILILAGRNIGAGTRPSGALADYLEGENASPVDLVFANQPRSSTFNDRAVNIFP